MKFGFRFRGRFAGIAIQIISVYLLVSASQPFAEISFNQPPFEVRSGSGTSYPDIPGSKILRGKVFENNGFRPVAGFGMTSKNVNLLTGQATYTVPIGSISAGGEATFNIQLSYSGGRQQFDSDNDLGPTSWIGFGWNFGTPFVAVQSQGTLTYTDDVIFCNLGIYGGGQLLQNSSGKYFVSTDPSIIVNASAKDANGNIPDWEFITASGIRLTFGKDDAGNNSKRTLLRIGDMMGVSPYTTSSAKDFIYRWDMSSMSDDLKNNKLVFIYSRTQVAFGSKSYTRESYIRDIIWKSKENDEIERYTFNILNKQVGEYNPGSTVDVLDQRLYETKRLDNIKHYLAGKLAKTWILVQPVKAAAPPEFPYPKMRLTEIQIQVPNPRGGEIVDPKMKWKFEYDEAPFRHSGLQTIRKPYFGVDRFVYDWPDYSNPSGGWANLTKQDPTTHKLTALEATSDEEYFKFFRTNSYCTERVCLTFSETTPYLSQMNNQDWMSGLQAWKNSGERFVPATVDGTTTPLVIEELTSFPYPHTLRVIPWNDNFLIVSKKKKTVILYEWNGDYFKKVDLVVTRTTSTGSYKNVPFIADPTGELNVTVGGDYIIVQDYNNREICNDAIQASYKTKVYLFKKKNGLWEEVNKDECTAYNTSPRNCPFNNNPPEGKTYGDTYKNTAGCMEFISKNIMISASNNMFHIVEGDVDIIFSYVQNQAGNNFSLISDAYLNFGSPQKTGYPMNWEHNIQGPIKIGKDYFLVKSETSTQSRYDIMHFDGINIRRIGEVSDRGDIPSSQYGHTLNAWVSPEYFILTDQKAGTVTAYFKNLDPASGTPTGISFAASTVRTDLPLTGPADVVVRTHSNAFTIEYYPNGKAPGGVPIAPPIVTAGNYLNYIYVVEASLGTAKYQLFSPGSGRFQDDYGRNIYDVKFSGTDNLAVGSACYDPVTNAACLPTSKGLKTFYTGIFTPGPSGLANQFIRSKEKVETPWDLSNASIIGREISGPTRITVVSASNPTTNQHEFALVRFMGGGYTKYPFYKTVGTAKQSDINYVKNFIQFSDIDGTSGAQGGWSTESQFNNIPGTGAVDRYPQFNCQTQTFTIPTTTIINIQKDKTTGSGPGKGISAESFYHYVDESATPVSDNDRIKIGMPTKTRLHAVSTSSGTPVLGRDLGTKVYEYYPPTGNSEFGWPENLRVIKLSKSTSTQFASNTSSKSVTTTFHNYSAANGSPRFTKTKVGSGWIVNQTLYASPDSPVPIGSRNFNFSTEPTDATLNTHSDPSVDLSEENCQFATNYAYQTPYPFKPKSIFVWRDKDHTLTTEDIKNGVEPIFLTQSGVEIRNSIEARNAYGQTLDSKVYLSDAGPEKHTITFYEGRASLPVGVIENAVYSDAAILTSENGSVSSLTTHDFEKRWTKADDGATSSISHTGKFSIKVVNNNGPTIDLKLRGPLAEGYQYIVSAWIYGDNPSNPPSLVAERFKAGTTLPLSTVRNVRTPVGEAYVAKKWQRYEFRIPKSELVGSDNLFATSGSDFLRVKVGGAGTGVNTVYVDDIVCRPNNSTHKLTSFDERGRPNSVTDNHHLTQYYEFDIWGNQTAVRDDKFRIFSSTVSHSPGEND